MDIKIKASKIELTEAIEAAINEKLGGLNKYFDNIIGIEVEVGKTTAHHHKGDVFRAEVNLEVPKKVIRAEAETDDLYKSLTEVKDKLKIELVKYKETHVQ
ncbi:MAG: Light-repressed protein A [Parcubacteria group bacterium ADurb.Bin326]|nr:MAG: Light-repressed protein A [Parcubacteria group bacterium ADurb.Bin326]